MTRDNLEKVLVSLRSKISSKNRSYCEGSSKISFKFNKLWFFVRYHLRVFFLFDYLKVKPLKGQRKKRFLIANCAIVVVGVVVTSIYFHF